MRHISVAIVLLACADSAIAGECSLPPARQVGNRELHVDRSGAVTAYMLANPANEYATVGGQSVQYDAAGNLVVDEDGRQYDYDSQNRLIAVRDAGMQTLATYMYDALGRRIVSDIDGVVTRFYHDGVSVIEERDAGDVRLRYHINGAQYIDERVASFDEGRGEHTYYLLNRDYSVAATGDASGASIVRQDFSALGDFTEPPRGYYFDADLDNDIDIADYAAFYGCMAGPGVSVSGSCALHDFERDDDVDLRDFKYFQMSHAGSREEPPQFARLDVTYYHDANGDRVVDLDDYYSSFYECVADADAMCLAVHDFDAAGVSDGEVGPADLAGFITCQDEAFGPEPCLRSEFDGTTPASGSFTLHGRQIDVLPDGKILTYIRARYYDPEMGRWLQRDPIGYADGANLYEAFGGNAARSSDPMGLLSDDSPGILQTIAEMLYSIQNGAHPVTNETIAERAFRRSCNIQDATPARQLFLEKVDLYEDAVYEVCVAAEPVVARGTGALQVVGGGVETGTGIVIIVDTGGGAVIPGIILTAHGVDTTQAGVRQLISGRFTSTFTYDFLADTTCPEVAFLVDTGLSLSGGLLSVSYADELASLPGRTVNAVSSRLTRALDAAENTHQRVLVVLYNAKPGEMILGSGHSPGPIRVGMDPSKGASGKQLLLFDLGEDTATQGGRLGNSVTRAQNFDIATELESRGWTITGGGGVLPEEYLPGLGPGTLGANYLDITAKKANRTLRINTIDTLADGVTPTLKEQTPQQKSEPRNLETIYC